jgi:hypothetical protein
MPYCDYKAYTLAAIENFYGSSFVGTFQEMLPGTWLGDTTSLYESIFSLVSLIPQREYDIILLQSEEINKSERQLGSCGAVADALCGLSEDI